MLEKALQRSKYLLRIAALSIIFLMFTTIISVVFVVLPILFNPSRHGAYDIGSIIAGSIVGQVTLLIAESIISLVLKKESKEGEDLETKKISDNTE